MPFNVSIPKAEQDPKLGEKLRAEAPGILAWAVQGCLKWQREGLGEPTAVSSARDQYREEMDVVADFIADCCIQTQDGRETFSDLYMAYQRWCQRHLEAAITSTALSAGADLAARSGQRQ